MKKTAFLFTGQGAQYMGMGKDLYENCSVFRDIFDNASDYLKINLKDICFDGELSELSKTQNLQPAIVTISYGIFKLLEKENIIPSAVAGFSLGEISAFASLGVLSFTDALSLVKIRGEIMEKACENTKGAMYSVIGLGDEMVEEICEVAEQYGYVIPANYNCPGQIVISGEAEAVEKAAGIAAEKGARIVKLNVSGAFHSELMKYREVKDIDNFAEFLSTLDFRSISKSKGIDFYSNLTGDILDLSEANLKLFMTDYIPKHMSSPVKFRAELENMENAGIENFVEIGVGKVLSGFVRRTCKTASFQNIEDNKSFMRYIEQ